MDNALLVGWSIVSGLAVVAYEKSGNVWAAAALALSLCVLAGILVSEVKK